MKSSTTSRPRPTPPTSRSTSLFLKLWPLDGTRSPRDDPDADGAGKFVAPPPAIAANCQRILALASGFAARAAKPFVVLGNDPAR